MKGSKKIRLAFLITSLTAVLSGIVLLIGDMYKVMEPVLVFGKLNLGIVLIVIGGILSLLAPKPPRARKGR